MIRSPSSSSLVLTKYLFGLLGLSLTSAACGGNVVDGGTGNVGGAGVGGGATTTSGAGGYVESCSPEPLDPSESIGEPEMLNICIPSDDGECPPPDSSYAFTAIAALIDQQSCDQNAIVRILHDVPCGPSPLDDACCYVARTVGTEGGCEEGRPFMVDGAARTAGTTRRSDWHAALAPDTTSLSAGARVALSQAWLRSASMEHASVASFARFALELLAVGAPAALVLDAQKAIGDEIRHAQACFSLASAYASEPLGPSALAIEGSTQRADLLSIAVATVREGCIGETVASLSAQAELSAATDPAVREALAQIAEDEAFHAGLAWRFVAWAVAQGGEVVREGVARAFEDEEQRMALLAGGKITDEPFAEEMRRHGRLDARGARTVRREAMSAVILPCARALLARAAETAAPISIPAVLTV